MLSLRLQVITLILLVVGCSKPPIRVQSVVLQTPDGPARGVVAHVDLSRVDVVVSTGDETTADDDRFPLQSTLAFALETDSDLAFNANYYGNLSDGRADPVGSVSNASVVGSPARSFGGAFDPAIVFAGARAVVLTAYDDGTGPTTRPAGVSQLRALLGETAPPINPEPRFVENLLRADSVAGVGASDTQPDLGTLLLLDGANLGTTARVQPLNRNPRTAAGVTADGRTLIVMVIDGRQPGHSVGVTLPELADLMKRHGADDALNLDGGGSSTFVHRTSDGTLRTNRPSDGDFRHVAVSVGIREK
ncbi:MAG: phosphodiester glycosidase family protein [Planctomycetota bacterium]